MGRLKIDCLAVNPNSTIVYGIGNAFLSGTEQITKHNGRLLLVRTEPNPTSFSDIRWRIVSVAAAAKFPYWEQAFNTVDCAVNQAGVFTAMVNLRSPSSKEAAIWAAIVYDPAQDDANFDGWGLVTAANDYYWNGPIQSHGAIYVNQTQKIEGRPVEEVAVRERFTHAVLSEEGTLRFGSFNPLSPSWNYTIVSWNLANSSGNVRATFRFCCCSLPRMTSSQSPICRLLFV